MAELASTVRRIIGPTIITADGTYFDYEAPDPALFTLNAIATGLANMCRFGGQCWPFYSVAEHSIMVSRIVRPELALHALLHDAAEAFILDMPKSLKEMLPDYRVVEKRIEAAMFPALGLPVEMPIEIKRADRIMLATEQRQLIKNHDDWSTTSGVEPLPLKLRCASPASARMAFIEEARRLGFPETLDSG